MSFIKGRNRGKDSILLKIKIFIKGFGRMGRSRERGLMCIILLGLSWQGNGMKDRF